MKLIGEIKDATTTQAALARYLKLSKPRINQLIDEGLVIRDDRGGVFLADSIKNYFCNKNDSNTDDENSNSYWEEKKLLTKAQRELAELKLAKARAQVYDAKLVEKTFVELLANIRINLLNRASKLTPQIVNRSEEEINEILTSNIEEILEELSNFDTDTFTSEEE